MFSVMFATGVMIGTSFGVLMTVVGTVWLGSLADERNRTGALTFIP